MVSRRNFLKGLGVSPALIALAPKTLTLPVEEEVAKAVPLSRLTSSVSASGGFCAPMTPYYDLPGLEHRPIRDSLPKI